MFLETWLDNSCTSIFLFGINDAYQMASLLRCWWTSKEINLSQNYEGQRSTHFISKMFKGNKPLSNRNRRVINRKLTRIIIKIVSTSHINTTWKYKLNKVFHHTSSHLKKDKKNKNSCNKNFSIGILNHKYSRITIRVSYFFLGESSS